MQSKRNNQVILIADDEEFFIDLMDNALRTNGFKTLIAKNGTEAWDILSIKGHEIHAVLLDRVMPDMDGIEILKKIKGSPHLEHLPVIIQSVKQETDDIVDGIRNGAYYYLSKPYDLPVLLAIVSAACEDQAPFLGLKREIHTKNVLFQHLNIAEFNFQSMDDVLLISSELGRIAEDKLGVDIGLRELMANAIEHGNLGFGYEAKKRLKIAGNWYQELDKRLSLPENRDKFATVKIQKNASEIIFTVEDGGDGFDWKPFMNMDPSRAFDPNGRGIYMAKIMSFDSLEYLGNGNKVIGRVNISNVQ